MIEITQLLLYLLIIYDELMICIFLIIMASLTTWILEFYRGGTNLNYLNWFFYTNVEEEYSFTDNSLNP